MPTVPDRPPASGASLVSDLSTASRVLSKWCVDRGINEKAPDDENIRILGALLAQSRELLCGSAVPKIPTHTIAIPARVKLTERRWSRFLRWFEEDYKQPMIRHCRARGAGALIPQRESIGRGGRGDRYEAQYFLSYEVPQVDTKPQRTLDATEKDRTSGKSSRREFDDRKSSPIPKRRFRFSYAIAFMALMALIAFMSMLSIIAIRGGTHVFVLSPNQPPDQGEGARKQ